MNNAPLKVMIAGGGVAALEAMIALRHLAEERVQVELVTPKPEFAYRPLAVAEPFGLGEARRFDLLDIAGDHGAALHLAGLQAVDPERRQILTWDGRALDFEVLLLAVGPRTATSIPGSVTITGYTGRFRTVLRELEERRIRHVAFAVPPRTSWPLPLYELALMTATRVAERGLRKVELSLVTPEDAPLEIFGARASRAVSDLLAERGVRLHTARHPAEFRDGKLRFIRSGGVAAERAISLPRLLGPRHPP
jgi:sulfide:quinone oxidoreductase